MDVLERVRDIQSDAAPVSEVQLSVARRTLLREIAREEPVYKRQRRGWVGVAALVGGIAAAAITVSVLAPARIDPAAAAVLENAATVTFTASDAHLAPGQYLRIQTDDDTLVTWDVDMAESWARFNNGDRTTAEAGFLVRGTRVLYVPADRSGDWIWDWSAEDEVLRTYGDRVSEAISDWQEITQVSSNRYWPDVQLLPGGEVPAADSDPHSYPVDGYRAHYDTMPRDSRQLLDWFRDWSGDPDVTDQWLVDAIGNALSANLMPADLRATMFRSLALIPGIRVAEVSGDSATLVYTSSDFLWSRKTEITINTVQGLIESIAATSTNNLRGSGPLPASVPDNRTTVTVDVVDSAPHP